MKNWKTTLFGSLFVMLTALSQSGVKIGHVGNTDVVPIAQVIAGILAAAYTKDHNVTGGDTKQ